MYINHHSSPLADRSRLTLTAHPWPTRCDDLPQLQRIVSVRNVASQARGTKTDGATVATNLVLQVYVLQVYVLHLVMINKVD